MNFIHRSILFSAVERYISVFLFLFSTAALARLLSPGEFGISAVVGALIAVTAASFQEFGGSNYLIQKASLSEANIRTAFTITLCLSCTVAILLFTVRTPLADVFGQKSVAPALAVAALNFISLPFTGTMSALLRREMQFGKLAIANLCCNFATAVVSVSLAIAHYSFMAPIWGTVAGSFCLAFSLILLRKDLRSFRLCFADSLEVLRFGVYSSGVMIINVFYNWAPQLFLARILDFAAVGLYGRAISITQVFDKLVVQVLGPVIMPALCARTREGGELRRIYLDAISLLSGIQWPFLLFLAIMARPIVSVWLGPMWMETIPLIRILCTAYVALFAACLTYPTLVVLGGIRDALISSFISLPPSLLVMFFSSFFGVEALAASTLITLPFQAATAFYFISRRLNVKPSALFRATKKSMIVTTLSSICTLLVAISIEQGFVGSVMGLIFAALLAGTSWWLGLVLTKHPLLPRMSAAAESVGISVPRPFLVRQI